MHSEREGRHSVRSALIGILRPVLALLSLLLCLIELSKTVSHIFQGFLFVREISEGGVWAGFHTAVFLLT